MRTECTESGEIYALGFTAHFVCVYNSVYKLHAFVIHNSTEMCRLSIAQKVLVSNGQLTSALHRLASEDLRSQGDTHTHTHHEGHKQELQQGTRLSNHTGEDLAKESISCAEVLVCLI